MVDIILSEKEMKDSKEKLIGTSRVTVDTKVIDMLLEAAAEDIGKDVPELKDNASADNVPPTVNAKKTKLKKFGYTNADFAKIKTAKNW